MDTIMIPLDQYKCAVDGIFSRGSARMFTALLIAAIAISNSAFAATTSSAYPSKPIRFIVPFTPGALNDLLARLIGEQLSVRLGQRIVVDNRPGAGTTLGSDLVAKSNPDGYTLLLSSSPLAINPSLQSKLPFDAIKDLAGVTLIGSVPFVLVGNPKSAITSIPELVEAAKAKPGQVVYGATVAGQLMVELFKLEAKVDIVHVPYKGLAPAMVDVMGGQVEFTLGTHSSLGPHIKAGRLRALAVTSKSRMRTAPDIPTIAEAGYKNFDAIAWYGVSVAGRTPKSVISRLHSEIAAILKRPEFERHLEAEGIDIVASSPDEFDRFLKTETAQWARVIKQAGIKGE